MPITFNTNLAALGAQRNIASASNAASSSLSKLSSGSRVPTAKDDAAALAVGSKLKAEVAGLTQAGNNAAQAISLLQIADGALSTIGDMLQRMKTLATQSSSGQLGNSERALLNQEFTNLRSEVNRIANVTTFNGTTLIAGGGTGAVVTETLISNALSTRGIDLSFDTGTLVNNDAFRLTYAFTDNGGAYNAAVPATFNADTYVVTLENTRTGARQSIDITQELFDKIGSYDPTANIAAGDKLDIAFSALGVNVSLNNTFDKDNNIALTTTATVAAGTNQTLGAATVDFATNTFDKQAIDALQALGPTVFNQATGQLTLTVDSSGANNLTLNATTGLRFQVNNGAIAADNTASANYTATGGATAILSVYLTNGGGTGVATKLVDLNLATSSASGASGTADGSYTVQLPTTTFGATYASGANTKSFGFKVGTGTSADDSITVSVGAATAGVLGIGSSSIDSATNADSAITAINTAINTISSRRADIGASQSRLEFASNSINVAIENATAATSALLDVDVSSEITKFTSKQVLLQAGVSLLAQANQQPALLLRLLQ